MNIGLTDVQFLTLILLVLIFDPMHDFTHGRLLRDHLNKLKSFVGDPITANYGESLQNSFEYLTILHRDITTALQQTGIGTSGGTRFSRFRRNTRRCRRGTCRRNTRTTRRRRHATSRSIYRKDETSSNSITYYKKMIDHAIDNAIDKNVKKYKIDKDILECIHNILKFITDNSILCIDGSILLNDKRNVIENIIENINNQFAIFLTNFQKELEKDMEMLKKEMTVVEKHSKVLEKETKDLEKEIKVLEKEIKLLEKDIKDLIHIEAGRKGKQKKRKKTKKIKMSERIRRIINNGDIAGMKFTMTKPNSSKKSTDTSLSLFKRSTRIKIKREKEELLKQIALIKIEEEKKKEAEEKAAKQAALSNEIKLAIEKINNDLLRLGNNDDKYKNFHYNRLPYILAEIGKKLCIDCDKKLDLFLEKLHSHLNKQPSGSTTNYSPVAESTIESEFNSVFIEQVERVSASYISTLSNPIINNAANIKDAQNIKKLLSTFIDSASVSGIISPGYGGKTDVTFKDSSTSYLRVILDGDKANASVTFDLQTYIKINSSIEEYRINYSKTDSSDNIKKNSTAKSVARLLFDLIFENCNLIVAPTIDNIFSILLVDEDFIKRFIEISSNKGMGDFLQTINAVIINGGGCCTTGGSRILTANDILACIIAQFIKNCVTVSNNIDIDSRVYLVTTA